MSPNLIMKYSIFVIKLTWFQLIVLRVAIKVRISLYSNLFTYSFIYLFCIEYAIILLLLRLWYLLVDYQNPNFP